jgi:hypothetical protein
MNFSEVLFGNANALLANSCWQINLTEKSNVGVINMNHHYVDDQSDDYKVRKDNNRKEISKGFHQQYRVTRSVRFIQVPSSNNGLKY